MGIGQEGQPVIPPQCVHYSTHYYNFTFKFIIGKDYARNICLWKQAMVNHEPKPFRLVYSSLIGVHGLRTQLKTHMKQTEYFGIH